MSKRLSLLALVSLAGCIDSGIEEEQISAFSLSAVVRDSRFDQVARAIADYARNIDERIDGARADWRLVPQNQMDSEMPSLRAAIELPDRRGYVIELCNRVYAEESMVVGKAYSVALPCEIAVYPDEADHSDIRVTFINPEAIYGVLFGGAPAEAQQARRIFSRTIHREFEVVVTRALKKLDVSFPRTPLGPSWTVAQLERYESMPPSIRRSIPIPSTYLADADLRKAFQDRVAQSLLSVLTHAGMTPPGSQVAGLSVSDWHSPRPEAKLGVIAFPLEVSVVELVSPTYWRQLLDKGPYHASALPFQVSLFVEGDELQIHYLDPAIVFGAFFSDVDDTFEQMIAAIRADHELLIDAALERLDL